MTNEDKAREIAKQHGICYQNHSKHESDMDSTLECYVSALKIAEWKDQQFNEERKELLSLVKMLSVDETNQTIIEDLIGILQ